MVYLEQENIDYCFKVIKCNTPEGQMQKPNEIFAKIMDAIEVHGLLK